MIVQCPACRALVAVSSVVLGEGKAGVRCGECGEVSWLVGEQEQSHSQTEGQRQTESQRQTEGQSQTESQSQPQTQSLPLEAVRERLSALPEPGEGAAFVVEGFEGLLGCWDDHAEHKKLVQQASLAGQLPALGVRYRAVLEVCRDEPMARRAQQEILALAMATLAPAAPVDREGPKRYLTVAALVISLVSVGIMGLYLLRMMRGE